MKRAFRLTLVALLLLLAQPASRAAGAETRLDVSVDMLSGSRDFFPSDGPFTFGTPVPYGVVNNLNDEGWIWVDGSFLTVTFPRPVALTRIRVYCVYNEEARGAQWVVEHSSDNASWVHAADFRYYECFGCGVDDAGVPMTGTGGWYSLAFNAELAIDQYWRIRQAGTINTGWSHAPRSGEMEFYGISEPPPQTAPTLTLQPVSQTVPSGTVTTFKVIAWGTLPLDYQWRYDGKALFGATTDVLALSNVQQADAGEYDVIVANDYGSVTSKVATLTVLFKAPEITIQPTDQCGSSALPLSLKVVAIGSLPMTYQWQRNGVDLSNGGRVGGAQSPTLTISTVSPEDLGVYAVVVGNAFGRAQSKSASVDSWHCYLDYAIADGKATITGYTGPGRALTIPGTISGLPVTRIGDYAFSGRIGLTSVMIPASVTSIGDGAFSRCTGLTNLVIGDSVTSIGRVAFYGCTGLTNVTIPNSVTSIGNGHRCYPRKQRQWAGIGSRAPDRATRSDASAWCSAAARSGWGWWSTGFAATRRS